MSVTIDPVLVTGTVSRIEPNPQRPGWLNVTVQVDGVDLTVMPCRAEAASDVPLAIGQSISFTVVLS